MPEASLWSEKLRLLPPTPGVYLMRDNTGRIVYIGKAINLRRRVSSYFRADAADKAAAIAGACRTIDYILAASEREALIVEQKLINRYKPYFNAMWRDDKTYPYLKLTLAERYPRLFLTRKHTDDGSEYFGPYPQVYNVKKLLRWMHRVFPWRPCRYEISDRSAPKDQKVKSCLYFHTGRCPAPCRGKISPEEYRTMINGVRLFLKGRFSALEGSWQKEMTDASAAMNYELAAELRDRIRAIGSMRERVMVREVKPDDLLHSLRETSMLESLRDALGMKNLPVVIEGFDISNLSGTNSVGAMVRFLNGKPDKSGYRKFKIKTVGGIDDFAMIKEVVYRRYRRLKSESKPLPDLILIDGGKGQLSSACEALSRLELAKQPVIGLAKREEEIFLPGRREPIKLLPQSPALQLLQRVRDEVHRFVLAFHHARRTAALGVSRKTQL